MQEESRAERVLFTPEMKKTHTILAPTMLPIHFSFLVNILRQDGYKVDLLQNQGRGVVNEGLKNVHNDTCYPALLVIGQMIDALESGLYDPHKVAFLITQTGGGCRASNYIFLLRKALKKSGYGYVPVISLNMAGLESNPGFKITLPMLIKMVYAVVLGDLIMLLANQCRPYERTQGETERTIARLIDEIMDDFANKNYISYRTVRKRYQSVLAAFAAIDCAPRNKVKVGVVGEIYVKYSPLGNNNLEQFLLSEGAEAVVPGLLDFCMYCLYNGIEDNKLYGGNFKGSIFSRLGLRFLENKQRDIIKVIRAQGVFAPPSLFTKTRESAREYINLGVKMGEGWLLTAEMVELIEAGVNNIVCTQPFGCLPNHIVGKGMMRAIKEKNPQANIVAVDYDPGASEVNQQNRIKLMLANAQMAAEENASQQEEREACLL